MTRKRVRHFTPEEVLEVYEGHPLRLETLKQRLAGEHKTRLTEDDLAFDEEREITERNHVGGAPFVLELAEACGVRPSDHVLDLGSGIGGPARLLASRYGCRVHGVDLNPQRHSDAMELTRLTGLETTVTFTCADIMALTPEPAYSVVWGQNSWIHTADPVRLLELASGWLIAGGRVAFEDTCLGRDPGSLQEENWLDTLSDVWRSSFVSAEKWRDAFVSAGLRVVVEVDVTTPFIEHYQKFTQLASESPDSYPAHEVVGWRCARHLGEAGALCFMRLVGVKD
ncbi:methyltransferase domain-containing protein [Sorangium sp. So ce295]|uniref:SAM-dependent methyltransferase n=1 Tax=Sorangium sp. So ce295 TaxID=3133295 RepID=UPI003F620316